MYMKNLMYSSSIPFFLLSRFNHYFEFASSLPGDIFIFLLHKWKFTFFCMVICEKYAFSRTYTLNFEFVFFVKQAKYIMVLWYFIEMLSSHNDPQLTVSQLCIMRRNHRHSGVPGC